MTTARLARSRLDTRRYDLRPIIGLDSADDAHVLDSITEAVGDDWVTITGRGGQATMERRTLVVEQSDRVHGEIADLLTQMTRITNPDQAPPLTQSEKNARRLGESLKRTVSIEWEGTSFYQAHGRGRRASRRTIVD